MDLYEQMCNNFNVLFKVNYIQYFYVECGIIDIAKYFHS